MGYTLIYSPGIGTGNDVSTSDFDPLANTFRPISEEPYNPWALDSSMPQSLGRVSNSSQFRPIDHFLAVDGPPLIGFNTYDAGKSLIELFLIGGLTMLLKLVGLSEFLLISNPQTGCFLALRSKKTIQKYLSHQIIVRVPYGPVPRSMS